MFYRKIRSQLPEAIRSAPTTNYGIVECNYNPHSYIHLSYALLRGIANKVPCPLSRAHTGAIVVRAQQKYGRIRALSGLKGYHIYY